MDAHPKIEVTERARDKLLAIMKEQSLSAVRLFVAGFG